MIIRKVAKILLGLALIALGVRFFIFLGDFNIIIGSIFTILGVATFFFDVNSVSSGKDTKKEEKIDSAYDFETDEGAAVGTEDGADLGAKKRRTGGSAWVVILVAVLIIGIVPLAGPIANWMSPEVPLTEAELLDTLSTANMIEMKGLLRSTNKFTYLYVNDERIGTVVEKGFWDASWEYQNKGDLLCTMRYSDDKPVEDDFLAYEFAGEESGMLGYAQTTLEDHRNMVYFYDADNQPIGYVDVESASVVYRDNWTVYDMDDRPVYSVTANYNALDKQLTYTIAKHADSEIHVLQVMGLNFMTRRAIRDYYD